MRILVVGAGGVGSAVVPIAARRDFFEHDRRRRLRRRPGRARRRPARRRRPVHRGAGRRVDAPTTSPRSAASTASPTSSTPSIRGSSCRSSTARSPPAPTTSTWRCRCRIRTRTRRTRETGVKLGDEQFAQADGLGGRRAPGARRDRRRARPVRRLRPVRRRPPLQRDRRDRRPRRREPRRRGLRLRAVVLDLDDDRGVPQPAGDLGARPRLVHDAAVQRARDVRLPRGDRAGRVRQRRARGGPAHPALGRGEAGDLQVRPRRRVHRRALGPPQARPGPHREAAGGRRRGLATGRRRRRAARSRRRSATGCAARPVPGPG